MPTIQGALDLAYEHSDKFLLALGRLVAESALLESQLDWSIWYLIGVHQRTSQIVTAELDFRRKVELMLALAEEKIPEEDLRRNVTVVVRGLHSLYNERNDYLHGMWAPSSTNLQRGLIRVSAKGKYKFSVADVDVPKIDSLSDRFNKAAVHLNEAIMCILLH